MLSSYFSSQVLYIMGYIAVVASTAVDVLVFGKGSAADSFSSCCDRLFSFYPDLMRFE